MVRTWGGSRLRPRVRFSTPEREPQLRYRLQYHHQSPRPYLRSLRDLDVIRHGWDRGPHHLCPGGELGGPGPPSGPEPLQAGPHIGPRRVIIFSASTVTSRISYRGDILTSAVTCLTDQEAHVRREPHSGERTTPSQTVPSGVVLRRPRAEG